MTPASNEINAMIERQEQLLGMLKRLLYIDKQLLRRTQNHEKVLRRLGHACHALQGRLERSEAERAAEHTASDVVIGAAMDALLEREAR